MVVRLPWLNHGTIDRRFCLLEFYKSQEVDKWFSKSGSGINNHFVYVNLHALSNALSESLKILLSLWC